MADKPVLTLKDKLLEVAIWANEIPSGDGSPRTVYSATIRKSYQDADGAWKTTNNYNADELIRLSALFSKAHSKIAIKVTSNSGFE